jgi:membrane protease YdiL (CAAX protease family)
MTAAIRIFIVTAYALAIALSLVIGLTGGHESPLLRFGLGYLSMLIPAMAVLVTKMVTRDTGPSRGEEHVTPRDVCIALLLMPVVMHAVMLPWAEVLGRLQWQAWLTPDADGLYHAPESFGWGIMTGAGFIRHVAMNAAIGLIIVSVLAVFEEIGWRAWLIPQLAGRIGARRAVVVSAVVWGIWHMPFALAGISFVPGVPILLTAIILPVGIIGTGLVLGWLWVRTQSVWLVALAHGALNDWGQYAFKFTVQTGKPEDALVLAAGSVALVCVGTLLLWYAWPGRRSLTEHRSLTSNRWEAAS